MSRNLVSYKGFLCIDMGQSTKVYIQTVLPNSQDLEKEYLHNYHKLICTEYLSYISRNNLVCLFFYKFLFTLYMSFFIAFLLCV